MEETDTPGRVLWTGAGADSGTCPDGTTADRGTRRTGSRATKPLPRERPSAHTVGVQSGGTRNLLSGRLPHPEPRSVPKNPQRSRGNASTHHAPPVTGRQTFPRERLTDPPHGPSSEGRDLPGDARSAHPGHQNRDAPPGTPPTTHPHGPQSRRTRRSCGNASPARHNNRGTKPPQERALSPSCDRSPEPRHAGATERLIARPPVARSPRSRGNAGSRPQSRGTTTSDGTSGRLALTSPKASPGERRPTGGNVRSPARGGSRRWAGHH